MLKRMHKSKRLFHGRTGLCLAAALIMMMTLFALPLQARTARNGNGQGIIGDVRDGIRDFGRDVSDMVDPNGDGILPDGSLDNGIANDGAQNLPDTSHNAGTDNGAMLPDESNPINGSSSPSEGNNTPGASDNAANGTDNAPGTSGNAANGTDNTPGTSGNAANGTDNAPGTSGAATTDTNQSDTSDNADTGFRWSGLIIALVIVAAVVLLIVLLIPKRKT